MKKIIGCIILISVALTCNLEAKETRSSEPDHVAQWARHVYESLNIQFSQVPPYQARLLPSQMQELGLDSRRVVFGQYFSSFTSFKETIDQANAASPVGVEALTPWEPKGSNVYSRVFRIGDKGVVFVFFNSSVIVADLGPHDKAVENLTRIAAQYN